MPYFSRLTDIVTCDLTAILDAADNPGAALEEIVREMDQGLAAAKRSVRTAKLNVEQIERDIQREQNEVAHWIEEAKRCLASNDDAGARAALLRKKEAESLIEGLNQSLAAAVATREQLNTTFHALHARMSDAKRKQAELSGEEFNPSQPPDDETASEIDAELAAMRSAMEANA